jgi:DNA end-binding protein Ku
LKALDLESSKVIDLEMFVPRVEVDPVYFNSPYYLYPDGQMALETIRVIGAAMADAGVVGIGRLTMSRRERMVIVDPRGTGMVLITLRAADEVRAPQFAKADGAIDPRCWRLHEPSSSSGLGNSIRAGSEIATKRRCGS